jgi:hypothetical protein
VCYCRTAATAATTRYARSRLHVLIPIHTAVHVLRLVPGNKRLHPRAPRTLLERATTVISHCARIGPVVQQHPRNLVRLSGVEWGEPARSLRLDVRVRSQQLLNDRHVSFDGRTVQRRL